MRILQWGFILQARISCGSGLLPLQVQLTCCALWVSWGIALGFLGIPLVNHNRPPSKCIKAGPIL